jgi:hypothetical protein
VQSPVGGHTSSQLPEEQSIVQGDELQVLVQLPDEQEHVPPEQGPLARAPASPGSETAGPPLGVPPPPEGPPALPQPNKRNKDRNGSEKRCV